mgnify:FL=1
MLHTIDCPLLLYSLLFGHTSSQLPGAWTIEQSLRMFIGMFFLVNTYIIISRLINWLLVTCLTQSRNYLVWRYQPQKYFGPNIGKGTSFKNRIYSCWLRKLCVIQTINHCYVDIIDELDEKWSCQTK